MEGEIAVKLMLCMVTDDSTQGSYTIEWQRMGTATPIIDRNECVTNAGFL